MKFLFIVQGEGRGHLTQAISLKDILTKNGHEVSAVMVGKNKQRELPDFFIKKMDSSVYRFESPNFLPSPKQKRANVWKSGAYNIMRLPVYFKSILYIKKQIKEHQVDAVINFYDMLAGITYFLFRIKPPHISISHQNMFLHPEYVFPSNESSAELSMLKLYTYITSLNAKKRIALAMKKTENYSEKNIHIVPPLLRKEVLEIPITKGDYLHGYMLNSSYADQIIEFQQSHPGIYMRFFWDKKGVKDVEVINEYLSFYKLNDILFLESMAGCKAYATTAGFESVCEAMYMGKPVLMVPSHIEQACNGHEAFLAGAGIVSEDFDLEALIASAKEYKENLEFQSWVKQAESYFINELIND
ncbi:glycosyltransferase [Bacteroidales bacterium OttesenSCG-928-M11]|nr:glycosyltransferase [Bacteroidales bacterium OttesenSCG-928-M11]